MTANQINKKWGKAFLDTLTLADAAIVCAIGVSKQKKVKICLTDDISSDELKKVLQGIIDNLGPQKETA